MRNNKGFTLVELTVSIALISVVMLAIGSMLISATVNNNKIYNQSEVHQNSELAITAVRTTCMEASQVYSITDSSGSNAMNDKGKIQLGEIVLNRAIIKDKSFTPTYEKKYYKFDSAAHTFSEKNNASDSYTVIATNIDNIEILPLPYDETNPTTTFKECTGIEVHFNSAIDDKAIKKKSEIINLESQFYFRNTDYRE